MRFPNAIQQVSEYRIQFALVEFQTAAVLQASIGHGIRWPESSLSAGQKNAVHSCNWNV